MNKKFSHKIKILPWIGKNYFKACLKILVLGMSTYNQDDPKRTCVRIMVKKVSQGENKKWAMYWIKIGNLLKNDDETITDFWNRISFYNYIQEIMDEPKQKTPKDYWQNSKGPFNEILIKLNPDIVIVTGYETFKNLPDGYIGCDSIKYNGKELKIAKYKLDGKIINICALWHPATPGFKYSDWKTLLKKYYKKII
jgi:hypothetical protein